MTIEEYKEAFSEMPEPKAKKFWVRDFHSMIVHTRGGHSEKLIGTRRPNEERQTFDYRIANDRAITRDAFITAITNLQRTMSHSAVEIRYPEKVKPFLESENFEGTDFISFIQRRLIKNMIESANALLVWWPENVGDPTKRVEMTQIVVFPNQIHHYNKDVLSWISNEKSEVMYNGKIQKVGTVHYIMLKDQLWKRIQTGKKVDDEYTWEPYYVNPIGKIYALPLGGDETSDDVEGEEVKYLTSYMSSAIPFADEAKVQFSDHQGVLVNCSSPLREIESIDCINPSCKNGKVYDAEHPRQFYTCETCSGHGVMPIATSSYGVMVRPKRQKGVNEIDTTDIPMMRFIYPDPSILKFGAEAWEGMLKKTEDALNLLFTDIAQSGIAKNIDREDKLAWLDKVAVNIYKYLVPNSVMIIYKFLFPREDYPTVTVNLPSTFVIKTEAEMIADLAAIRQNGMPEFLIIETTREFISKKFGGDPVRMKIFDTLMYIDPLFIKTQTEKVNMLNSGAITESDLQFSNFAPVILANYTRETPEFGDMTIEQIAAVVTLLIQAKVSVRPPEIEPFG